MLETLLVETCMHQIRVEHISYKRLTPVREICVDEDKRRCLLALVALSIVEGERVRSYLLAAVFRVASIAARMLAVGGLELRDR